MDSTANRPAGRTPWGLGAVVLSGCLTGIGAATEHGGLALNQPTPAVTASAVSRCSYCGLVEGVREIENAGPRYQVSTVVAGRDEAIVMLLSALTGTNVAVPPKIYEVSVRMDDGSIRAFRDGGVPEWKPGDRVQIIKGQVEPLS